MSAPTALNTGTPMVNDVQTQALRRIDAYHTQLHRLGLHMDTPIRVLGVLTSGLPGEVLELSLLDETGHLTTHRARPVNPIPAAATAIHGLTDEALCQAWPLARRHAALLTRLRSPDRQGHRLGRRVRHPGPRNQPRQTARSSDPEHPGRHRCR